MNTTDFQARITQLQEKIGEETAGTIADDLASLIADNETMNQEITKRDNQISDLQKRNTTLITANGNLLQQVSMGFQKPKDNNEEDNKPKSTSFKDCFDEKGNFKK